MKFDNYKFDQSGYERAGCKYRCGRSRFWKKSCWQGPTSKGGCGGSSDCSPVKVGDRYECTRPEKAGGPCEHGPFIDGDRNVSCYHKRHPCQPTLSVGVWRSRLTILSVLLIIGLIASFAGRTAISEYFGSDDLSTMPGNLSSAHSFFSDDESCSTCHENHDKPVFEWILSAFQPVNMTKNCLSCHRFSGTQKTAHNLPADKVSDSLEPGCIACHTEHNDGLSPSSEITNDTCNNCHKQSISRFDDSHPDFAENYPHRNPEVVFFNHSSHLKDYFVSEKHLNKRGRDRSFAKKAAKRCTTCHQIEGATRQVKSGNYEQMCIGCHDDQIKDRLLLLLNAEEIMPVLGSFMEEEPDEKETRKLMADIKKSPYETLMNITGEESNDLWAGINPAELRMAMSMWMTGESYEPVSDEMHGSPGWHAGLDNDDNESLFYRPKGHNDEIIRYWIETILKSDKESAEDALDALLDPSEGPGACGKCHTLSSLKMVNAKADENTQINWQLNNEKATPYTAYTHTPHLNLMGDQEACQSCHKLSGGKALEKYFKGDSKKYQSNFSAIEKATCSECHSQGKIADNCTTCHVYHTDSTISVSLFPAHHKSEPLSGKSEHE